MLNALTITIALTMDMEATLLPLFDGLEFFYSFESEILVLHRNMWLEVINVFKLFFVVFENF